MNLLTQDAVLVCAHELGIVGIRPTQDWVAISGRRVLVEDDPPRRPIVGCPNIGIGIKPCTGTLAVTAGYSDWVRIDGRRVCLDSIVGRTDGTPPGIISYKVRRPGQSLVSVVE